MNKFTAQPTPVPIIYKNNFLVIFLFVTLAFCLGISLMYNMREDSDLCPSCRSMEYRETQFTEVNHRQYPKRRKHQGLDYSQRQKDKKYRDKHV